MKLIGYNPLGSGGRLVKRIDVLDSVRGLAAVSVMINHVLICYPIFFALNDKRPTEDNTIADILTYSPLHVVWAGSQAVLLFFILSGFVLALPFLSETAPGYGAFILRRLCRIYVPYAVALIVAVMAISTITIEPVPGTGWFPGSFWQAHITSSSVVGYLLMTGLPHHKAIDPVVWSLVHEMRVSLIFPFLFVLVSAMPAASRVITFLVLSIVCTVIVGDMPRPADGGPTFLYLLRSLLQTARYVWLFVLGIELARHRDAIIAYCAKLSSATWAATLLVALGLYVSNWLVPVVAHRAFAYPAGIGAALFILLTLTSPAAQRILTSFPLLTIGRWSYSLYLFHPIVLLTLIYALHRYLPLTTILIIVPVASIGLAGLMYRIVERPAMQAGRYLTANSVKRPIGSFPF
jgi:peptidoglycan/LPS O-acetylase OafA/YrhL